MRDKPPRFAAWRASLTALALGAALGGCMTYRQSPLPRTADLGQGPGALKVDAARLRVAPLKPIVIDPRDGLDPLEVAVLAVLNSPDLKARRAALRVDDAQVFAAGLLPDPQLSGGLTYPIAGTDTATGYNGALTLDVAGLLGVVNTRRAARFSARQADLDLLWAEWTTAQQARALAETALADDARARALREVQGVAADRSARSSAALAHGDVTAQTAAADLAVKLDAQTLAATAEHDALKARRDLNALLGLDAAVVLPLVERPPAAGYSQAEIEQALSVLPHRRPDLLALQAGYAAQDANLRKAVIAQFPIANVAFNYGRDTTPTTSLGPAATAILPLFNTARAEAKVQSATRDQLRAEYQARLDATDAEVKDAATELAAASAQAAVLRAEVPRLEALAAPAARATARGDLDSQAYLTLTQSVLSKRADLVDRELARRAAEIQLETALFLPPPEYRAQP